MINIEKKSDENRECLQYAKLLLSKLQLNCSLFGLFGRWVVVVKCARYITESQIKGPALASNANSNSDFSLQQKNIAEEELPPLSQHFFP